MKNFGESETAVSAVIGVVLMVGLTVVMISAVAVSVLAFTLPENAPQVRIVIEEVKGGLPPAETSFQNNAIYLKHKGGDLLDINNTRIIITGIGRSHTPCADPCPYVPPYPNTGDVRVTYTDLTTRLKDNGYKNRNPSILDGEFSAGESLLLSGEDRGNSNDDMSSVITVVNGNTNTSNKYAFDDGTTIQVTFIDISRNHVIAVTSATVKLV